MEKVSQGKITRRVNKNKNDDYHKVKSTTFIGDKMILKADNNVYEFRLKDISKKLLNAGKKEREAYRVICSGYGINWPLIDEDLSIDGLIKTHKKLNL